MTFDELCAMEPRLRDLEGDVTAFARSIGRTATVKAMRAWYGRPDGFKQRLVKLVGVGRVPAGFVDTFNLDNGPDADADGWHVVTGNATALIYQAYQERLQLHLRSLPTTRQAVELILFGPHAYGVAYRHLSGPLPL